MHPRIRKACKKFFTQCPHFSTVEWDGDEVTAVREHDPEPFVVSEYIIGSPTRIAFEDLEEEVCDESPFSYHR